MDRRSASASNEFNLGFETVSSGSIAATASSGYNGVKTDDTDPDLTFLSNLFPVNYTGANYQSRDSTLVLPVLWLPDMAPIRLPGLMKPGAPSLQTKTDYSKTDYDHGVNDHHKFQRASSYNHFPTQLSGSEYPQHFNNYTYRSANDQAAARKRQFLVNFNTPTYSPIGKVKDTNLTNVESTQKPVSYTPDFSDEKSPLDAPHEASNQIEILKMELNLKTLVNKTLNEKLKAFTVRDDLSTAAVSPGDGRIAMPSNYHQLFEDLTRTLNERTQELEETKSRMDAILVGLVMNKESSVFSDGSFDPQELAHRITTKLSTLQKENQSLLRMVSHGNQQSLLVEMGLLKNENKVLRAKIAALEKGS